MEGRTDLSPLGQLTWNLYNRIGTMITNVGGDFPDLAAESAFAGVLMSFKLKGDTEFNAAWAYAEEMDAEGPDDEESHDEWRLRVQMAQLQAFATGAIHSGLWHPVFHETQDWRPDGNPSLEA